MIRFTIRDVLWLMVVVGLAVALFIQHRRLATTDAAFQALRAEFQAVQAEIRFAQLRAKELRGEVILPASPDLQLKRLERRSPDLPRRAVDDP